jgi:hypothetical protein
VGCGRRQLPPRPAPPWAHLLPPLPLQIYVPPHALIKHWLGVMRSKDTPSAVFRSAASGGWVPGAPPPAACIKHGLIPPSASVTQLPPPLPQNLEDQKQAECMDLCVPGCPACAALPLACPALQSWDASWCMKLPVIGCPLWTHKWSRRWGWQMRRLWTPPNRSRCCLAAAAGAAWAAGTCVACACCMRIGILSCSEHPAAADLLPPPLLLLLLQVVPILRAGLVLLEQASTVLPSSQTYHVGYVRNEETLEVRRNGLYFAVRLVLCTVRFGCYCAAHASRVAAAPAIGCHPCCPASPCPAASCPCLPWPLPLPLTIHMPCAMLSRPPAT